MPKIYRTLELKSRIQNSKLKKMYVPFENLPEESKIWVYQSNRKFSPESEIESALPSLKIGQHTSLVSLSAKIQQVYYTGSRSGCSLQQVVQ
jgi:hypothetical protein